jgi:DNA-binding transcriptional MocR family regulator
VGVNKNIVTMTIWRPTMKRGLPRYLAITEALAEDVASAVLAPGTQLPTHRDLADRLGVTVGTVSRAYAEAARRGLTAGEVGRGTFVRAAAGREPGVAAESDGVGAVDMSINHPPPVEGADEAALKSTLGLLSRRRDLAPLLAYPPDAGSRAHREAAAEWLDRGGHRVAADRIVVCNGSQHGLVALLSMLAREGDVVLTEELTYPGLKAIAGLMRLRLAGVAIDEDGVVPDALDEACRTSGARILYCVPTVQNPTAAVMSGRRRAALAAVIRRHGLTTVEDDVHGRLATDPPSPVAALLPESTYYVTSTSKTLAPGLRVGFVAAPPGMAERLAATVRVTTWGAAPLTTEVVAGWILDGAAEAILTARRNEAAARHALARETLAAVGARMSAGAYHVWMALPEPWRSATFAAEALQRGVAVTASEAFLVGGGTPPAAVRLCLGTPRTRADLLRGLRAVRQTLESRPETALAIV